MKRTRSLVFDDSLTYDDEDGAGYRTGRIHHSVLQELARARLEMNIFPNLRHLQLSVDSFEPTQMPFILLQKDLQSLSLSFSYKTVFVDDSSSEPEEFL